MRTILNALVLIAALTALGCDNFSLTSRLTMPDQVKIQAASSQAEINGASITLKVMDGAAPFTFSVNPMSIYSGTPLADSANPTDGEIGFVDADPAYNPGTSIGRMRITVSDQKGDSASTFITVGPLTPTLTSTGRGQIDVDTDYIDLSWTYPGNTLLIDEFRLQRRGPGETSYTGILTVSRAVYTSWVASSRSPFFTDNTLQGTGTYEYRLYAVSIDSGSGENFWSVPYDLVSAP